MEHVSALEQSAVKLWREGAPGLAAPEYASPAAAAAAQQTMADSASVMQRAAGPPAEQLQVSRLQAGCRAASQYAYLRWLLLSMRALMLLLLLSRQRLILLRRCSKLLLCLQSSCRLGGAR